MSQAGRSGADLALADSDLICRRSGERGPRLLFIEPYLADSHAALARGLMDRIPARWTLLGLKGRFFRWRMRGATSYLASQAADLLQAPWDGLIVSDMLNLAELKGLVPVLANTPALVYFHENQLAYPAPGLADQEQLDRDLFLAFTNLTSIQAARLAVFNSVYHRDQFQEAAQDLIQKLPDARPTGLAAEIAAKARVLPVPLDIAPAVGLARPERSGPLRLVWNHRWEPDKGPEEFFDALQRLADDGLDFEVAVLGRAFGRVPEIFEQARARLGGRINQWGWAEDRAEYWRWLFWADVAVSTARQEYLGLSLAEAVWAGCRPLAPDALVYPELYPGEFRYPPGGLYQALADLAARPERARGRGYRPLVEHLTWPSQETAWQRILEELTDAG